MQLIGLTGHAGVGKDEVAKTLGLVGYQRYALADRMREAMLALDPYVSLTYRLSSIVESLGWDAAKREYPEIRRLLQRFGTDVGRELLGEDAWIILLDAHITADANVTDWCVHEPHRVVVTDVRFGNEARWVHRQGGMVVRVHREGVGPVNAHVSDAGINDRMVDRHVHNDGDLDDLERNVLGNVVAWLHG